MILFRLRLNLNSRHTLRALANPEIIHAAIMASQETNNGRTLWRIDQLRGNYYLLILSPVPLNADNLEKQFGSSDFPAEQKNYDQLLERIVRGSVWQFRLTANPQVSLKKKVKEERARRVSCINDDQRLDWLEKQSKKHGFEISESGVRISKIVPVQVRKKHNPNIVSFTEVTFDGYLRVTDSELFRKALVSGIGRTKAYGVGLMTLISVHE